MSVFGKYEAGLWSQELLVQHRNLDRIVCPTMDSFWPKRSNDINVCLAQQQILAPVTAMRPFQVFMVV